MVPRADMVCIVYRAITDANGDFAFDGVEPGRYEVRYGKPGQVVKAKLDLGGLYPSMRISESGEIDLAGTSSPR